MIYDCHTLSMKVEPVMSDTLVQCHIDMVIYDCHIPTMKVEPVMSDTPLLDSSVATCGWVGVDVGVWVWMWVCGCGYMLYVSRKLIQF